MDEELTEAERARMRSLVAFQKVAVGIALRWWLLFLAFLYRISGSEVALAFALLVPALVFGLAAGRLLREKGSAANARRVFALLIGLDLLSRLIPLRFNLAFGLPFAILGFLLRLGCLALVWLDLRAEKKARLPAESGAG